MILSLQYHGITDSKAKIYLFFISYSESTDKTTGTKMDSKVLHKKKNWIKETKKQDYNGTHWVIHVE